LCTSPSALGSIARVVVSLAGFSRMCGVACASHRRSVMNALPDPQTRDEVLGYHGAVSDFKRRLIEATLHQARGNRTHAARTLGLQRTYLLRLIRELQVAAPPPPTRTARVRPETATTSSAVVASSPAPPSAGQMMTTSSTLYPPSRPLARTASRASETARIPGRRPARRA
jgi:DNA-binding protein Fis